MKGLKKFKTSLPECNRDGIVQIFDVSIEALNCYELAKENAKARGERWSIECSIRQASVYAYEGCIVKLGLWDKFIEYRKLKALTTP